MASARPDMDLSVVKAIIAHEVAPTTYVPLAKSAIDARLKRWRFGHACGDTKHSNWKLQKH